MRPSLWIIFAVTLGAGAGTARAGTITFDVSAGLPAFFGSSCSPSPCKLSGTLTIDNTLGTLLAADLNFLRATPSAGPFSDIALAFTDSTVGSINGICDASEDFCLSLDLLPFSEIGTTPFTLVGYGGGPIYGALLANTAGTVSWRAVVTDSPTGKLVATPEPGTTTLMLIAIGLFYLRRQR
jgi:PEP-CTERM motif